MDTSLVHGCIWLRYIQAWDISLVHCVRLLWFIVRGTYFWWLVHVWGIYLVYDLGFYGECLRHIVETLTHIEYLEYMVYKWYDTFFMVSLDTWFMVVGTYLRHMVWGISWLHVDNVMAIHLVSCWGIGICLRHIFGPWCEKYRDIDTSWILGIYGIWVIWHMFDGISWYIVYGCWYILEAHSLRYILVTCW